MKRNRRLIHLSFAILFAFSTLIPATALANPGVSCDINGDGVVNLADIGLFASLFFTPGYQPRIDFNCDGVVNLMDLSTFATCF